MKMSKTTSFFQIKERPGDVDHFFPRKYLIHNFLDGWGYIHIG